MDDQDEKAEKEAELKVMMAQGLISNKLKKADEAPAKDAAAPVKEAAAPAEKPAAAAKEAAPADAAPSKPAAAKSGVKPKAAVAPKAKAVAAPKKDTEKEIKIEYPLRDILLGEGSLLLKSFNN